jgi:hypothetical protein
MSKARDLANAGTALGAVTATELAFVDGVTSAIQTQIDSKIGSASAISPTIVDAKGDIIAATAADTVSKLTVGSNDTVLTADSSTATGLKWATPSALPSQTNNTNKFLSTNGTTASWSSIDGSVSDWKYYFTASNPTATSFGNASFVGLVNGYWFATTSIGYILYSSTGTSGWTRWASTATENVNQINGVLYGNGTYVIYTAGGGVYSATTLGGTLTSRTSNFTTNDVLDGVYVAGSINLFIIVGESGKISTSSDGITWTARTSNQSTAAINTIATNGTDLVICASNGAFANNASYSTNGTTWTAFSPNNSITGNREGQLFYDSANTKWVYCDQATSWYESTSPTSGTWTTAVSMPIMYSVSAGYTTRRYNGGGHFLSKDATNNKWIVANAAGNGRFVVYTFDPTTSNTVNNGKTYKLESAVTLWPVIDESTNTYSATSSSAGFGQNGSGKILAITNKSRYAYTNL